MPAALSLAAAELELVRPMCRGLASVSILLLSALCGSAAPHGLHVAPEVRREDVPQICATVSSITRDPVLSITALDSPKWPHRTDPNLVMVRTGYKERGVGDGFKLCKIAGGWVVTWKGTWVR